MIHAASIPYATSYYIPTKQLEPVRTLICNQLIERETGIRICTMQVPDEKLINMDYKIFHKTEGLEQALKKERVYMLYDCGVPTSKAAEYGFSDMDELLLARLTSTLTHTQQERYFKLLRGGEYLSRVDVTERGVSIITRNVMRSVRSALRR